MCKDRLVETGRGDWGGGGGVWGGGTPPPPQIFPKVDLSLIDNESEKQKVARKT